MYLKRVPKPQIPPSKHERYKLSQKKSSPEYFSIPKHKISPQKLLRHSSAILHDLVCVYKHMYMYIYMYTWENIYKV